MQKIKKANSPIFELLFKDKKFYDFVQTAFAYNSGKIEGIPLTDDEVAMLYFEGTSRLLSFTTKFEINDIVETANHFRAFDYVLNHVGKELNFAFLKILHSILKHGVVGNQVVGDFKKRPNMVGNYRTVAPANVVREMSVLVNRYNKIKKASFQDIVDFHVEFERIHPFEDGNGRCGRLIMFKQCLENDLLPFVVNADTRKYYMNGIAKYPEHKGFLTDTLLHEQDNFKEAIDEYNSKAKK